MVGKFKKMLVADDLKPLIEKKDGIWKRSDFKIYTAQSGLAAIDLHRSEKMNLIAVNLDMLGLNGDELCTKIRSEEALKNVSVLLICNDNVNELNRCKGCGANGYVTRPVDPERLSQQISSLLEVSQRQHYRILIRVTEKTSLDGVPFFCSSLDISKSGILFETEHLLSKGDIIVCSFYISAGHRIMTEAEVARIVMQEKDRYLYGVKFINLKREESEIIDNFVSSHALHN